MPGFERPNVTVRTKPKVVALVTFAIAILGLMVASAVTSLGGVLIFLAIYLTCIVSWTSLSRSHVWRKRRAHVRADENGLSIDGRLIVARESVTAARLRIVDGSVRTCLDRRFAPVEVELDSEDDARALVSSMRLDLENAVVRFDFLGGGRSRSTLRLGALLFVIAFQFTALNRLPFGSGIVAVAAAISAPVLLLATIRLLLGPASVRISVGTDGLGIRQGFGRESFLSYGNLTSVHLDDGQITLRSARGPALVVSASFAPSFLSRLRPRGDAEDDRSSARSFVELVNTQLAKHRARTTQDDVSSLARAGRPVSAWLRDLGVSGSARASYRAAAVPADTCWRVLADGTAPATHRVGAAVVLAQDLDPAGRARIRAVAEACAAPRVRVALEAIAEGRNELSLARALDSVDDHDCATEPPRATDRSSPRSP